MRPPALVICLAGVLPALTTSCSEPGPPLPCESAATPEVEIHVGESFRVVPCFRSEALPLAYSATTTDPAIVSVEVAGRTVEMSAEAVGQAVLSVTATDVNGKSTSQNTLIVVPNRAPFQVAELPLEEIALWSEVELYLNDYIVDPDREALNFQVRTHDRDALKAESRGDTLVVHAVERASPARFDIKAADPHGESFSLSVATEVGDPMVYLTQGSHARQSDVPLIAGKPALMRLFLVTDSLGVALPDVTASILHRDGSVLRSFNPSRGRMTNVPLKIDESRFDRSFAEIVEPEHLVAGAMLVVEIEKTKDPAMARRIERPLNVVRVPVLELTLVPIVVGDNSEAVETVAEIERDPLNHPLLHHTRTLLPVPTFVLRSHLPFHVDADEDGLIEKLGAMWEMEGGRGVYLGIIPEPVGSGLLGQAYIGRGTGAGYAVRHSAVIAHEMGHIFGLLHAPCGTNSTLDRSYPYARGVTGVWGYDFESRDLVPPDTYDVMIYCDPVWISDYHYGLAIQLIQSRLGSETSPPAAHREQRVLALQGRIDAGGIPVLRAAFHVEGTPTKMTGGAHEISGSGPGGQLFSYRFAADEIMDGPGGSSFFHLIPVTWRDEDLAWITLTAPDGRISTWDADTGQPNPIVIREGQVVRWRWRRR